MQTVFEEIQTQSEVTTKTVIDAAFSTLICGQITETIQLVRSNPYLAYEVDSAGNTLLHLASTKGYVSLVETLISQGAKVNVQNLRGEQPLHCALMQGHKTLVTVLVTEGADRSLLTLQQI